MKALPGQQAGYRSWKNYKKEVMCPKRKRMESNRLFFQTKRPFHPVRFWNYLSQNWPAGILRSKGLFWIASRPDAAVNWSQAGGSLRAEAAGVWWASMPLKERIRYPAYVENRELIESRWGRFGDRMNELVIIGQDLDRDRIFQELKKCLCSDQEINAMESGKNFMDPFPEF